MKVKCSIMHGEVTRKCLRQLLSVYVLAEQQYLHSAIFSASPLFQAFFRQKAFERSDLILQLSWRIESLSSQTVSRRTVEQFYELHHDYYGGMNLYDWPVVDIDTFVIDDRAVQICNCFLNNSIPEEVCRLIKNHKLLLESSLLTLTCLRALDNNV